MNCDAFFTALSDKFLPAQNNISPEEFASGRLKNCTKFKIISSVFLKNVLSLHLSKIRPMGHLTPHEFFCFVFISKG